MIDKNPIIYYGLIDYIHQLEQHQQTTIVIEHVMHEQFKALSAGSKAVIRSGECSAYANVLFLLWCYFLRWLCNRYWY